MSLRHTSTASEAVTMVRSFTCVIQYNKKKAHMKQKILLLSAISLCAVAAQAQVKAYAITGTQKGSSNWSEVRLVDVNSGTELQTVYKNKQAVDQLNARTGKAIVKNEQPANAVSNVQETQTITYYTKDGARQVIVRRSVAPPVNMQDPFATTSAALAYDKKHDRLYYTPMGIAELRYIDMKSNTTRVHYFENETFGAVKGRADIPNQVTRMVIAADGKGYALSNNAEHLIRFETDKRPEIKDLGTLTDDPANAQNSIHNQSNYGGDMIADAFGALYLITANARVYKIDVEQMTATYKGRIKGLPAGFTANGAAVETDGEASVVICSSTSTEGYYHFDLNTLQAAKVAGNESSFNASDLANGNLAFSKKKKKDDVENQPVVDQPKDNPAKANDAITQRRTETIIDQKGKLSVFPNPVTTGVARVSFKDYDNGRYQLQLLDISGKLLSNQAFTISSKMQVEEVALPKNIAKGNYLVKVISEDNKIVGVNSIIVQ